MKPPNNLERTAQAQESLFDGKRATATAIALPVCRHCARAGLGLVCHSAGEGCARRRRAFTARGAAKFGESGDGDVEDKR